MKQGNPDLVARRLEMVNYLFPSVGGELKLERTCPHCHRLGGRLHSAVRERCICDIRIATIAQQRLHCAYCGTSWTVHAEGVKDGCQHSDRLRAVGVCLYMLGLSYRAVADFCRSLEWQTSKNAVERDVRDAGQNAKALHEEAPAMRVRVLGVDGTGAKMAGIDAGMLFFVDVEDQRLVCVEPVQETDAKEVRRHIQRVLAQTGAQELRTDELSVYDRTAATEHAICLAHWLKSKCKRAWDLAKQFEAEAMTYEAQTMRDLIALLHRYRSSPKLPEEIERLVRRFLTCREGVLWKANQLLQHIERTWSSVSRDPADPTNNTTERLIGLTYKIRAKTMRGFKSPDKALAHPYLAAFLRGSAGVCHLRQVI
jgi:transposase-like protein